MSKGYPRRRCIASNGIDKEGPSQCHEMCHSRALFNLWTSPVVDHYNLIYRGRLVFTVKLLVFFGPQLFGVPKHETPTGLLLPKVSSQHVLCNICFPDCFGHRIALSPSPPTPPLSPRTLARCRYLFSATAERPSSRTTTTWQRRPHRGPPKPTPFSIRGEDALNDLAGSYESCTQ